MAMRSFRHLWPALMVAPLTLWLLVPDIGLVASWPTGDGVAEGGISRITVVYVGADDCAPCRKFHEEQWPAIRNSARLTGINFREVRSPTFRDVLDDKYWTADLRPYRNALPHDAGVPLWVVVRNGSVVKTAWGVKQWDDQVMPLLRGTATQ